MSDARLGLVLTVVGATAAGFGAAVLTHRWCVQQQQQQRAAPPLPPRRHADGMRAVQRQALALMQTQRRAGALVAEARAHIDSAHAAAAAAPAQGPPYPALFASYVAMRPSDFADIRFVSTCKHFLLIATHFFFASSHRRTVDDAPTNAPFAAPTTTTTTTAATARPLKVCAKNLPSTKTRFLENIDTHMGTHTAVGTETCSSGRHMRACAATECHSNSTTSTSRDRMRDRDGIRTERERERESTWTAG